MTLLHPRDLACFGMALGEIASQRLVKDLLNQFPLISMQVLPGVQGGEGNLLHLQGDRRGAAGRLQVQDGQLRPLPALQVPEGC